MIQSTPKGFSCDICEYKYKTRPALARHKTMKHGRKMKVKVITPLEEKRFGLKRSTPIYKCNECDSNFDTEKKLEKHTKSQHNSSPTENTSNRSADSSLSSLVSPPAKSKKAEDNNDEGNKIIKELALITSSEDSLLDKNIDFEPSKENEEDEVTDKDDSDDDVDWTQIENAVKKLLKPSQNRMEDSDFSTHEVTKTEDNLEENSLNEKIKRLEDTIEKLRAIKDDKNTLVEKQTEEIEDLKQKNFILEKSLVLSKNAGLVMELVEEKEKRDKEYVQLRVELKQKSDFIDILTADTSQICLKCNKNVDVFGVPDIENSDSKQKDKDEEKDAEVDKDQINMDEVDMELEENVEHVEKHDDNYSIQDLVSNKHLGYRRSSPQSEATNQNKKCNICDQMLTPNLSIEEHMSEQHNDDGDWYCGECDYQTNTMASLKVHRLKTQHGSNVIPKSPNSKCNNCDLNFLTKTHLNEHIKVKHRSFKPCIKFKDNKCEFDSDCRFNHIKLGDTEFICYRCGDISKTKHTLLLHIKEYHGSIKCVKFVNNQCKFTSERCIYNHETNTSTPNLEESVNKQDFYFAPQDMKPPDKTNMEEEPININTRMIMNIVKMMETLTKEIVKMKKMQL